MTREELIDGFLVSFSRMHRQNVFALKKGDVLRQGEQAALLCIHCTQTGNMKSTEVAAALKMSAPAITPILNRLEQKGYIKRSGNSKDRRMVIVSLTKEGAGVLNEALCEQKARISQLTDYLGESDSQELLRLIQRMQEYYMTQDY